MCVRNLNCIVWWTLLLFITLQENIDTFKEENDVDAVSEEDSTGLRSDEVFIPSAEPEVSHSFRIFLWFI
jgi:predicted secreted protein